jgi:hypothetical protein
MTGARSDSSLLKGKIIRFCRRMGLLKTNALKRSLIQLFLYFCEHFFVNFDKNSCSEWDENL